MRVLMLPVALLLALLLAACATTLDGQIAVSCQSYATTLSSLAEVRDRMTEDQVETVEAIRAVANPICMSDTHNQGDLMALSNALRSLSRIEAEVQP